MTLSKCDSVTTALVNGLSKRELTGNRDLTYSHWHRGHRTGHPDSSCTAADIDMMEYCASCGEPLLLIETAVGNADTLKNHNQLYRLAEQADVPAVLVFYEKGTAEWCGVCRAEYAEPVRLWVRDVWPVRSAAREMAPLEWAAEIEALHADHECRSP